MRPNDVRALAAMTGATREMGITTQGGTKAALIVATLAAIGASTNTGCHLLFAGYSNKTPQDGGAGGVGGTGSVGGAGGSGGNSLGGGGSGASGGQGGGLPCTIANDCIENQVVNACNLIAPLQDCIPPTSQAQAFGDSLAGVPTVLDIAQHGNTTYMLTQQQTTGSPLRLTLLRSDNGSTPLPLTTFEGEPGGSRFAAKIALRNSTEGAIAVTFNGNFSSTYPDFSSDSMTMIAFDASTPTITTSVYSGACNISTCPDVRDLIAMPAVPPANPLPGGPFRYLAAVGGQVFAYELDAMPGFLNPQGELFSCGSSTSLGHGGNMLLAALQGSGGTVGCLGHDFTFAADLALCPLDGVSPDIDNATCFGLDAPTSFIRNIQTAFDPDEAAFYVALQTEGTLSHNGTDLHTGLTAQDYVVLKAVNDVIEWSKVVSLTDGCIWRANTGALAVDPFSGSLHIAGAFCEPNTDLRFNDGSSTQTVIDNVSVVPLLEPWVVTLTANGGMLARSVSFRGAPGTTFVGQPILAPPSPKSGSGVALAGSMRDGNNAGTIREASSHLGYNFLFQLTR